MLQRYIRIVTEMYGSEARTEDGARLELEGSVQGGKL